MRSSPRIVASPRPAPRLSRSPLIAGVGVDEAAEREMGPFQELITAARTLRADCQLGPKDLCRLPLLPRWPPAVARHYRAFWRTGDINSISAPKLTELEGAFRSTPEFRSVARNDASIRRSQRSRLERKSRHLKKLVADKDRQLGNEEFLRGAPSQVVKSCGTSVQSIRPSWIRASRRSPV